MLGEFRARRDLVVNGLNALPGVSCRVPHGAFYAFPNVAAVPLSADVLAERLLSEAGVALLSGTAVGAAGGKHPRRSDAAPPPPLGGGDEGVRRVLRGAAPAFPRHPPTPPAPAPTA